MRNHLKIAGINQEEFASKIGMSRQNLNKYFNEKVLKPRFKEALAANGIKLFTNVTNESNPFDFVESLQSTNHNRLNKEDKSYITPLIKSVLTMGMLLKMNHEQLMSLLADETNSENFKLIQEVISTKKELEHLREQNQTLKKYAESLEKQIRQ